MPLLEKSSYKKAPFLQFNGHLQTIIPSMRRQVPVHYERERLELKDGDFLDLDWIDQGSQQLVLLTHGLESSTDRHYMKGMAKFFSSMNWDVLAWNCRSCSGEMNRNLRLYHHGEIEDIDEVLKHALRTKDYEQVVLIGFSMGGAITMKYLGVHGTAIPEPVKAGIAFSAPCNLKAAVKVLEHPFNFLYKQKFLNSLKAKIEQKAVQFPDQVDLSHFDKIESWKDFDDFYSGPLNGYKDAEEFYAKASAMNFMEGIKVPTLLVNAQNDPILNAACSPVDLCRAHPNIYLEQPKQGGHVGFHLPGKEFAWSEYRAYEFVREQLS